MLKHFLYIALVAIVFISCTKENVQQKENLEDKISEIYKIKNQISEKVAKNLTKQIHSAGLKTFIKKEALKKFDGASNFLITKSIGKKIETESKDQYKTFGEFILDIKTTKTTNSLDLIDSIQSFFPLLQITVVAPEGLSIEDWSAEKEAVIVAYVPQGQDSDEIPAFDSEGNSIKLSKAVLPNQFVIVLTENERIIGIKRSEKINTKCFALEPYYSTIEEDFYLKEQYYDQINECSIENPDDILNIHGNSTICTRDTINLKDRIKNLKFVNITKLHNADDPWYDGPMEIELHVFLGRKDGKFTELIKYFTMKDTEFKDCNAFGFNCDVVWADVNVEIVTWDKSIYGDSMLYRWLEDDGGGTQKTGVSFSTKIENTTYTYSGESTIPLTNWPLGESIVEYCDNTVNGTIYSTGEFEFIIRQ